jgi:hypothetical protein
MNHIRSLREIGIYLLIDFRKAFDLVEPELLILKLKCYGFHYSSLSLIKSYFTNRQQRVKINGTLSAPQAIQLSVPQGSVLGPLFFLLFINDLAMFIKNMKCTLFADDSTLSQRNSDLKELLFSFNIGLNYLTTWCKNNRLDINWSKTFVMFVTNKHVNLPNAIEFNGNSISVVSSVKLLGVTIDN